MRTCPSGMAMPMRCCLCIAPPLGFGITGDLFREHMHNRCAVHMHNRCAYEAATMSQKTVGNVQKGLVSLAWRLLKPKWLLRSPWPTPTTHSATREAGATNNRRYSGSSWSNPCISRHHRPARAARRPIGSSWSTPLYFPPPQTGQGGSTQEVSGSTRCSSSPHGASSVRQDTHTPPPVGCPAIR